MSHSTYKYTSSDNYLIKSILKDGVSVVNEKTIIEQQLDEFKVRSIELSELNELISEGEHCGILDTTAAATIRELRRKLKGRVASRVYADKKKKKKGVSSSNPRGVIKDEEEIGLLKCRKRYFENKKVCLLAQIEVYKNSPRRVFCEQTDIEVLTHVKREYENEKTFLLAEIEMYKNLI